MFTFPLEVCAASEFRWSVVAFAVLRAGRSVARVCGALLAACALLTGCTPKVVPTGVLVSYSRFDLCDRKDVKVRRGPDAEALARFARPAASDATSHEAEKETGKPSDVLAPAITDRPSTRPLVIVIQPARWAAGEIYTGEDREELLTAARDSLHYFTGENYPPPVMYRHALLPNDPLFQFADVVFVESLITDVRKGFAPFRHPFFAWTSLGSASIQLEGRLHADTPSGPVIGEYAVRARNSGAPEAGPTAASAFSNGFLFGLGVYPKVYSNVYCLRFGLTQAGFKVLPEIKKLIPPPAAATTEENR